MRIGGCALAVIFVAGNALPVSAAPITVRRNDRGLYGLLLQNLTPFLLDPRFDFTKTYWLFTGIFGADPKAASVGSAAWARWVVNGDELREIDDREVPADWPNAQRPPFVLLGETLGSVRYWHGPHRTQWARDWAKLWTHGEGTFVMTNMESQSAARTMDSFAKMGFVDLKRVMVLRTASNASGPPPGVDSLSSIGDEAPGQLAAYESNYRVGSPVVHELLGNWMGYCDSVPQSAGD